MDDKFIKEFEDEVGALAIARSVVDKKIALIDELEDEFSMTELGKRIAIEKAILINLKESRDAMENDVRSKAENYTRETGDNSPHEAVKVQMRKVLSYSEAEAIHWAETAKPDLVKVSIDKTGFEKIAKAAELDFVKITVAPKATVATDLTKFAEIARTKVQEFAELGEVTREEAGF
jgi:hypothetical protein